MSPRTLEEMGLAVTQKGDGLEAELELVSGQLLNPLTRRFLGRARFSVVGERLFVLDPPELVGSPPIAIGRVTRGAEVEQALVQSLNECILQLQRRSQELSTLGIEPRVDPETLQLTAEVRAGDMAFQLASDRQGHFFVGMASRNGEEMDLGSPPFELSEFRERQALEGYLVALAGGAGEAPAAPSTLTGAAVVKAVTFAEIAHHFGREALLPPSSGMELLVEVTVRGESYRFAAARVSGRTFRGLLAGKAGKVWAERFELDAFPGVRNVVSGALGVAPEEVQLGLGKES